MKLEGEDGYKWKHLSSDFRMYDNEMSGKESRLIQQFDTPEKFRNELTKQIGHYYSLIIGLWVTTAFFHGKRGAHLTDSDGSIAAAYGGDNKYATWRPIRQLMRAINGYAAIPMCLSPVHLAKHLRELEDWHKEHGGARMIDVVGDKKVPVDSPALRSFATHRTLLIRAHSTKMESVRVFVFTASNSIHVFRSETRVQNRLQGRFAISSPFGSRLC